MKVGVVLDDKLAARMDEYAKKHYLSRSSLIAYSLTTFLNAQQMNDYVQDIAMSLRIIASKNAVDDELKQELDKLNTIADFLNRSMAMKIDE